MKYQSILFCVSGLLLLASCGKDFVSMDDSGTSEKTQPVAIAPGSDTTNQGAVVIATVQFKRDIIPILKANCLSCHDVGDKFPCDEKHAYATIVSQGFSSTTDPENCKFFKNSIKGHPDDYLTPADHDQIVTWMREGALNN